jgi:hypothetical protein
MQAVQAEELLPQITAMLSHFPAHENTMYYQTISNFSLLFSFVFQTNTQTSPFNTLISGISGK